MQALQIDYKDELTIVIRGAGETGRRAQSICHKVGMTFRDDDPNKLNGWVDDRSDLWLQYGGAEPTLRQYTS